MPVWYTATMKARIIAEYVRNLESRDTARILVLTGARQTGKTTLCRTLFPGYTILSIEDPVMRGQYSRLTAAQWRDLYPTAILDEIQKEPSLIESIKSVYDQWKEPRYVLTGSSQLLLMEKVRESLAGRCVVLELFPLTLPELASDGSPDTIPPSPFISLAKNALAPLVLPPSFLLDPDYARKQGAWDHYKRYGAYPALTAEKLSDDDRHEWLRNYVITYLERDIRDLASFRDMDAFVKLQRYLALQTATVLNLASIAKQLSLNVKTVSRYLRYFEMSYQAVTLPAWSRNPNKRLAKAPKLHYLDNGVVQAVLQKKGGLTGFEFESLVVAEMFKQLRTHRINAPLCHLRTLDGREVDLLVELPSGYFAFEIKMAERVSAVDARHLRGLSDFLDKPLLGSFVLSQDPVSSVLESGVTAIHAAAFLG